MIKILGLVHGHLSSHTVRVLAIANALRETGKCEIVFSGSGPFIDRVRNAGFPCIETPLMTKRQLYDKLDGKVISVLYDRHNYQHLFSIEDSLLKEYKPDIIIRDLFREFAAVSAKQSENRIYDVFIQKAPLCPYYHFDFRPDNLPKIVNLFPKGSLRPFRDLIEMYYRKKMSKYIRKKLKELHLNTYISIEGVQSDLVLIADAEELFPLPQADRRRYKHIGPVIHEDQYPVPRWLDEFKHDPRKKILISTGTTGEHEQSELFKDAFPLNCFATALFSGASNPIEGFYGCDHFDLKSILPYINVFITHGGSGSTYRGIQHNVPMLILYDHIEQQVNAVEVERAGLGISMKKNERSPKAIQNAVNELMINPVYKQNSIDMSERIFSNDPVEKAVDYILKGYASFKSEKKPGLLCRKAFKKFQKSQ